jgi:transposase-like protein
MGAVTDPTCPFCESAAVELVSLWGGQLITSQWRCEACGSYFEALRESFDDAGASRPPMTANGSRMRRAPT